MRFIAIINNDEAEDMGEESTLEDVQYEVGELLRSGYYDVEELRPL